MALALIDTVSALDTFIYAGMAFIVWNFYWTRKQKEKLFGDPRDETTPGVLKRVKELEEEQEQQCHNSNDETNSK